MKYYFKENFRMFLADGQLYDLDGNVVYTYANSDIFLPEVELFKDGRKIGGVQKRFRLWMNRYDIYHHGQLIDSLQQQFHFFSQELYLERHHWTIKGDWLALDYAIYDDHGNMAAQISQEVLRMTRRYYVNIIDEAQEELIMLLILAINQYDKDISSHAHTTHIHSNN